MMAPIKVRVNTFVKESQTPFIDPLSKCYIIASSIIGLNRLPVLLKGHSHYFLASLLICVYSLAFSVGIIYKNFQPTMADNLIGILFCIEYMLCVLLSFMCWKRIERYYNELNKFDAELGCRPKMSRESIRHLITMTSFFGCITLFNVYLSLYVEPYRKVPMIPWIVVCLTHSSEISFCGHLLSLIAPRLRLINYHMEAPLSNRKLPKQPNIQLLTSFKNKNKKNSEMKKLMNLYNIITNAFDLLIHAIKWQMLAILIGSFIYGLSLCYHVSLRLINNETFSSMDIIVSIIMMTVVLLPMFSPCIFGDQVHNEVRRLRELIASRLYENKLDKGGRGTARALLALTESQELSFSLLQMLQVDVSLPFKFIGLLVTYLIILLQFDKVIHPPNAGTQLNNVSL